MLKARNIIIIFVVNYLLILFVSGILELIVLNEKAKHMQTVIRTSADMALEQSQVIDDFLSYGGRDSYSLLMPSTDGNGFVEGDLFGGVFGLDSSVESNAELIFRKLYDNNDFKMLSMRTNALRTPVKYWNYTRTGFDWYYIPKISMIGTNMIPKSEATTGIVDRYGNYVPTELAQEIMHAYRLNSHVKTTGGKEYYNTPLNFGVTYLNEDLLGTLFMNNMDLLMRYKYSANLNTPEGGNGVLKGTTYSDRITEELSEYNPINDGLFTLLRGTPNSSVSGVETYSGVTPLITYKVVDMYDSANDPLLVHLFGSQTGSFGSKADYLKDIDRNVLNPVTMTPYQQKPIVVAKVTFYADVIVPYFSVVMRDLKSFAFKDEEMSYIDVEPTSGSGFGKSRRISYTTYFAVTP